MMLQVYSDVGLSASVSFLSLRGVEGTVKTSITSSNPSDFVTMAFEIKMKCSGTA